MKNTLTNSYEDENGQWWYLQPTGIRQRAKTKSCLTCKEDFLTYPTGGSNYCSVDCFKKPCIKCGEVFHPKTKRQVYCSVKCKKKSAECQECKKNFYVGKGCNGLFCSQECHYENLVPTFTVRKDISNGYSIIKVPPETKGSKLSGCRSGRWMLEHRYVMQQMLGRPLGKFESVHHMNGKRDDNNPENLELWKRSQPAGIRNKDYHCPGCRCHEH